MKVETTGILVTDVPGIESITIEPSQGSELGVHAAVKFAGLDYTVSFGIAEMEELSQATARVAVLGREMAGQLERNQEGD